MATIPEDEVLEEEEQEEEKVFKVPAKMEKLHIAEVLPGVWIGDRFAAADRALLDARHISMVVNCAAPPPPPPGEDAKWVELAIKLGFVVPCFWAGEAPEGAPTIEYLPVPVKDEADAPLAEYFDATFEFITRARAEGRGVLVHCVAGRSRSASVLIAFLMKQDHLNFSQALSQIKLYRGVNPNAGFVAQLHHFAKKHGLPSEDKEYLRMGETGEVSSSSTDAITTNIHTCLWRLQQGAWYTTNPTEVANLKSTGFTAEAYIAVGVLAAVDKDADSRNLMRELLRTMLSAGEVSKGALCEAYQEHLLEHPEETEFPILQDLLLDVPYAEEYVGGFVGDAFEHLTPEFQEFVSVHYPVVHTHMLSAVQEAQQQTLMACSPKDTNPKSKDTRPENSFEDIRAALGQTLVGSGALQ
mmetsp:Transcript_25805/g.43274  ORF Transcript_25805/g.43274 Transcript_25805/m.43274 type:complete len:413 (+) Transcript_25805:120-1358(+)|eukprot:CAMPEP_0198229042 /NCGR_PEP_ID=MMETSP1445-20131203/113916_1 /TAXON_ID=36898 /ORGANISM="Pyramimonas sp., Strain CCMP2087" /LENGTH=412 /DNA_ID=CAMNT_0043909481 /DNA_START=18 /DNA_END=1256 /DNA_ORIENTATION=+